MSRARRYRLAACLGGLRLAHAAAVSMKEQNSTRQTPTIRERAESRREDGRAQACAAPK